MQDTIAAYARRLGDDALVMGQRLCEWCSNAPLLEEDLALANTALDYLGRARMLYTFAGEQLGRTEDELAYFRGDREFENALIMELPRGDFAFSMARQYLLDVYERLFFEALERSTDETLRGVAAKVLKEVAYHQRRSAEWLKRLGLGTTESNERTQVALNELWGYIDELFEMDDLERELVTAGVAVDRAALEPRWRAQVSAALEAAGLAQPDTEWRVSGGREGIHTEHLGHMLTEMQVLQRSFPGLDW